MDRRTLLTGSAAALLGAIGVGRLVARDGTDGLTVAEPAGPSPARPSPSASPAAPSTSPTATVAPTPAPTAGPSRTPEPAAPSPSATADASTAAPTADPSTAAPTTEAPAPSPTPAPDPSSEPPGSPAPAASGPLVVPLLCRDAWRAAPVRDGLVAHDLRRITIHHTAVKLTNNRDAPARLRQHQRYHQDQGWADIAYHVSSDRNGNLYELRTTDAKGDTFTSYDPAGHLLILAEGDFNGQQPTDAQLEGLARLVAWGHTRFGLGIDTVSGHRDHAGTSCPGDALYAKLGWIRDRAAQLVAAGGVELRSRCGAEGRDRVAAIERGDA